jgi:type II secretory pathway component GspD/PulD (secretin)
MKNYRFLALPVIAFLFALPLGLFGGGCASAPQPAPAPSHPKSVTLNLKSSTLDELTDQLSQMKSTQVTVSTRSLKALIVNQQTLQNQCRSLSTQLEALKSLDVEEYESHE